MNTGQEFSVGGGRQVYVKDIATGGYKELKTSAMGLGEKKTLFKTSQMRRHSKTVNLL